MPPDPFDAPGPFDTEQQARQLPAVREVYQAFRADPGVGKMAPHNLRLLLDALAAAGVYVGAYDIQIAQWVAGWEPQTVAVIAGWVQRAGQARGPRRPAARQDARETARRSSGPPQDRATATHADPPPAQGRPSHAHSISRAADTGLAPREARRDQLRRAGGPGRAARA